MARSRKAVPHPPRLGGARSIGDGLVADRLWLPARSASKQKAMLLRNSDLSMDGASATLNVLSGSADAEAIDIPAERRRDKDNRRKSLIVGRRKRRGNAACFSVDHGPANVFQFITAPVIVPTPSGSGGRLAARRS